jgi:hypothetical protein
VQRRRHHRERRREDPRDRRVRRAELTEAFVARAYELMLDAAARDVSVPPAPAEPAV